MCRGTKTKTTKKFLKLMRIHQFITYLCWIFKNLVKEIEISIN